MLRLANTDPELDDDTEEAITVAEAARRLGCHHSTVRELLVTGELKGHRIGKGSNPRGVRVHVASIRRYKARNELGGAPTPANDTPRRGDVSHNAAGAEAKRRLRALGML